jgi:hypothetical protein
MDFMDNQNQLNEARPPASPPAAPFYLAQQLIRVQPPPTKRRSLVGLVLVALIVTAGICFTAWLLKTELQRLAYEAPSGEIVAAETYAMKDRPHYGEMVDLVNRLYDKYTKQDLTGEIWVQFDSDIEDYNYVIDYLSELNYYHQMLAAYEQQQSSSWSELDYEIEHIISDLNDLEAKFIAKAPLTTTITITLEDGSRVAVAKKTKTSIRYGTIEADIAQDSPLVASPPLEKEAWARNFEGSPGNDGTYRTAAGQLAENFDMYLDYNWANILNKCIGSTPGETEVIAAYCHATPDVVYVNKNATNYANNIRNIMFVSTIKHEISHHIIATICGTARPPIAGANTEGVTNSYANIFLGAHEKNEYYVDHPEYQMSAATDGIARAIHDERRCV